MWAWGWGGQGLFQTFQGLFAQSWKVVTIPGLESQSSETRLKMPKEGASMVGSLREVGKEQRIQASGKTNAPKTSWWKGERHREMKG